MGHLKTINFPFETNKKLMVLGVPILKHFRVIREDVFKSKAISHDMRFPEIKLDSIPVHKGLCSGNLLSDFRLLRQQFIYSLPKMTVKICHNNTVGIS